MYWRPPNYTSMNLNSVVPRSLFFFFSFFLSFLFPTLTAATALVTRAARGVLKQQRTDSYVGLTVDLPQRPVKNEKFSIGKVDIRALVQCGNFDIIFHHFLPLTHFSALHDPTRAPHETRAT